jgi:hypothetical protein
MQIENFSNWVDRFRQIDSVPTSQRPRPQAKGLRFSHFAISFAIVFSLNACGSGATNDNAAVTQRQAITAIPMAAAPLLPIGPNPPLISSPPTVFLDYRIGSEEKAVFDAINAARSTCGFGMVYRNENLDLSIGGHMGYLLQNNFWGHYETKIANSVGYVGATPTERAQSKGYPGPVGEALVGRQTQYQGGGLLGLGGLATAAYHLVDLFRSYGDIGLTVAQPAPTSMFYGNVTLGIQFGYARKTAASGVRTYPCNGVTVLETKTYATELPNPIPNRDASAQPLGHPIFIRGTENSRLTLSSIDIRQVNNPQSIEITTLHSNNDPNKILQPWEAVAIPLQPLRPSNRYEVKIIGIDNGRSFEQGFTFETAAL